jgi:hypothetical protein
MTERGPRASSSVLLGSMAFLVLIAQSAFPLDHPAIISCFLIGGVSPRQCPLTGYFREDPMFRYSVEPIPADLSDDDKRKIDRQYFPRSQDALLEYEFIAFTDARVQHFTPRQFSQLEYAFLEAGVTSFSSFGPSWLHAFETTILYNIVPISEYDFYFHRPWRVSFRRDREPVFLPFIELGVEKVVGEAYGEAKPRQGSTTWADMIPNGWPWLVSWRPGGKAAGIAWVCADEFNSIWWGLDPSARGTNPYAIDLVTNLVLYSRGRPLIADIQARREARRLLSTFQSRKLVVLSMMEWADAFGANILPLSQELTLLEMDVESAALSYLDQEYALCITGMESMEPRIASITGDAVRLKDEALFWVYLSEWLAVTSVGMVSGVVVWSLMVRRRMYRSVGVTRLTSGDEGA